ncbi:MAG: histidine phosphatase family protein [Gammaproteobacteria bacterium]|nr:histidine phosphatase family protein [Gammaproteobacteria bacterium]MCW9006170.1 histidine phosphatase family protein [Gammaproteobacteria bacterium]MCW9056262.1 histidine phosphatase family protein [Gammaproteobacteria bacterium]
MSDTRIDIIRHGEPEGGRRYRGHSVDDPLSKLGWQQMWNAVPEKPIWDHIITSPLSRCHSFAEALAETLSIEVTIEDNLKEIGFGSWEGRSPEDIKANEGDALQRFLKDPVNNRPDGAEPLDTFAERVWDVYQNTITRHHGQHILIVAHAGVIRAITSNILGMSLDDVYSKLKIEYAAVATTRIADNGDPVMVLT